MLTLGNAGSARLVAGTYTHEPIFPTTGRARFGSGDAFDAGYLYAYLEGPLFIELAQEQSLTALALGNAMAALKRCIEGDIAVINQEDVRRLLSNQRFR